MTNDDEKRGAVPYSHFSASDDMILLNLVSRGYSYKEIGKRLGRSQGVITYRANKLGVRQRDLECVYSLTGLVETFFRSNISVRVLDWIRRGWLQAKRRMWGARTQYRVTHDAFLGFLEQSDYWFAWEPVELADRDTQEWAQGLRDAHPWKWITTQEAAEALNYSPHTVRQWVNAGKIESIFYRNGHYIRSNCLAVPERMPRVGRKLSFAIAQEIRREYKTAKITQQQLAFKYGVTQTAISNIVIWKTYRGDD